MFTQHRQWIAAVCCLIVAGCASTLSPAPAANQVPGRGDGAIAVEQGIHLIARAGAWEGTPRNLHSQLTPMRVTVINESAVPVRINYSKFRLVSSNGRRYSAIPPFQIEGKVTNQIGTAYYAPVGFRYAPYLSAYLQTSGVYDGPYVTNTAYWNRYAPLLKTANLPTSDMLQRALPEGVLLPGGQVTGFLYFEGVGPGAGPVRLVADFPNAQTGARAARIAIPFSVG